MTKPRIAITCGPNIDRLPPYLDALAAAGAEGVVFQAGTATADQILADCDGILIPGGGDIDPAFYSTHCHPSVSGIDRARDELEKTVVLAAHAAGKPLFGICRGMQVMGWALGGRLYQDIDAEAAPQGAPKQHRQMPDNARNFLAHDVTIPTDSHLGKILGVDRVRVNSIHHQAVRMAPASLQVNATAPDGLIEGLEDPHHPWFIGVQCHPEEILDRGPWKKLFEDFVRAARRASGRPS